MLSPRRRRAFLIVVVLFLLVLLITMGFGLLGSRSGQYQAAVQAEAAVQARALARAGLEDARTKLNRDLAFPPVSNFQENAFTYSEDFYDVSHSKYLGCYQVTVDMTLAVNSGSLTMDPTIAITSVG